MLEYEDALISEPSSPLQTVVGATITNSPILHEPITIANDKQMLFFQSEYRQYLN